MYNTRLDLDNKSLYEEMGSKEDVVVTHMAAQSYHIRLIGWKRKERVSNTTLGDLLVVYYDHPIQVYKRGRKTGQTYKRNNLRPDAKYTYNDITYNTYYYFKNRASSKGYYGAFVLPAHNPDYDRGNTL